MAALGPGCVCPDFEASDVSFLEASIDERIERAFTKTLFTNGRRQARQPAMMPAPGSIVDQIAMFVAFPIPGVSDAHQIPTVQLTEKVCNIRQTVNISKS